MKQLFLESNVAELVRAPDKRRALSDFFLAYYEKLKMKDLLEPNELAILVEFHLYNFEFAKDELLLPDDKAALLMNILSAFVVFTHLEKEKECCIALPEGWTEDQCRRAVDGKFDSFKETLLAFSADNPPTSLRVFSTEELRKTLDFASRTYLRHFPLFMCAFNTQQRVKEKSMTIYVDEPIPVPALKDSNLIPQKDKEPPKTAAKEAKQAAPEAKKAEEKAPSQEEPKPEDRKKPEKAEKKEEEQEKNVDKMIEALSLSEGNKQAIYAKLKEMKDELENKLTERQKGLETKLEEMKKGKGKAGKKPAK